MTAPVAARRRASTTRWESDRFTESETIIVTSQRDMLRRNVGAQTEFRMAHERLSSTPKLKSFFGLLDLRNRNLQTKLGRANLGSAPVSSQAPTSVLATMSLTVARAFSVTAGPAFEGAPAS